MTRQDVIDALANKLSMRSWRPGQVEDCGDRTSAIAVCLGVHQFLVPAVEIPVSSPQRKIYKTRLYPDFRWRQTGESCGN